MHCYVEYNKPTNKFSYDKGDYDAIREQLSNVSWEGNNINELWTTFASNLITARDAHIPTFTPSTKPSWKAKPGAYCPDKATRDLVKNKARLHNLYQEHKTRPDAHERRKEFTRARNHVRTVVRKKKRNHERDIAKDAKTCPKKFWAYCSSKTRTRSGVSPLLRDPADSSSTVHSDAEKSEVLQDQYCGVFTNEGDDELPAFTQRCDTDMPHIVIDPEKVRKKLKCINTSKSAGPDGLHPRLIKECADVIAEPLAKLYQASIDSGSVPDAWKQSVVSPIFKKGARNLAANYRPVSLTAILC